MTGLRELAAGVMCCGFQGVAVDARLRERLRDLPLAGLVLFARNIDTLEQTRALTDDLRSLLSSPILAIDQEGGRVARLRDCVEQIPSMMALAAASRGGDLAARAGAQMAFDLRRAGLNLDFAPVLDLALEPMNTVIGTRSFGDDPNRVAMLAGAFAGGLRAGGIAATLKHFPGHGSTAVDSHLDLPAIDCDLPALESRDFVPFADLLPRSEAVMTAHIVVRALDPGRPATLSPVILTELLRSRMRFAGVCFTDCLQMDAIAKTTGTERAAVEALAAGADCVLISHDLDLAERTVDCIVEAAEAGRLSQDRLREAHERVSALRRRLCAPIRIDAQSPSAGVGTQIGRLAVTRLRGEARPRPGNALVISFEGTTIEGVQGKHTDHPSLSAFAAIDEAKLPLEPAGDAVGSVLQKSAGRDVIVLMRRAHVYNSQKAAIERILEANPEAVLVSVREPFDALDFPQAKNLFCTYGDDDPSIAGLAAVLFAKAAAGGVFPLNGSLIARAG